MTKQVIAKTSGATDYRKFGYVLVKPSIMPTGTVPIIIVGHGAGETGDGTDSKAGLWQVRDWGGFTGLHLSTDQFKFVVINLQTSSRYQYGEIQQGINFAKTLPYYNANDLHYYGVSLGGYGFEQQAAGSSTLPATFATITLAAPGPGSTDATGDNIALSGRPIWILHAHNDCVVTLSNSTNLINDIKNHGGSLRAFFSVWKDRTTCSGCCTGSCPTCSTSSTRSNTAGTCVKPCEAAHNMVSLLVCDSWNTSNSVNSAYNILPTYPLGSGRGNREISSGTLAKMGWHQWVKSNKKGQAIVAPTSTYTGGTTSNTAPTASAGGDKDITLPTNSVTLNGSAIDKEGGTITYSWTKVSGPSSYTIASPNTNITVVDNLVEGTYVFRLTAKDFAGLTDTDDVTVVVNPEPPPPPPPVNGAPTARAGADQTITLPINSVSITGVTSSDPDGTSLTYKWSKISGPTANITSSGSAATTVTSLVEGTYTFRLTVTDPGGLSDTDDVVITVKPAVVTKTLIATFRVYDDGSVEKI